MELYTTEEVDRINKMKETNDRMEEFFLNKRSEWSKNIDPIFEILKKDFNQVGYQNIIDAQATALSYRMIINEQISLFLNKRSKEEVKIKRLKQDKFLYFAMGFGLKTTLGEKTLLIDGHIGENDRAIQIIEIHIEFLRNCSKNLESFGYTVKNIIELMNYLK